MRIEKILAQTLLNIEILYTLPGGLCFVPWRRKRCTSPPVNASRAKNIKMSPVKYR
jgi:hypothetical protein